VKTPSLAQLLADYKPDFTVIALGSNPTAQAGVEAMLDLVHKAGSACAWVGPPYMRNPGKTEIDNTYKNALARASVDPALKLTETKTAGCSLIDSRNFSYLRYPDGVGDGTHYEATQDLRDIAQRWAKDAAWEFAGRLP
jgi:hypothetical protein